jgi:glutamine amidotransferase
MAERVVVIDYGAGNLCSVDNALRVAVGTGGGATVAVSSDPDVIARADRIVLPGVGAFGQCIGALRSASGIEAAMTHAVRTRGVPFLGICVGMQLLATEGVEHGVHRGLDWIGGTVARIAPADATLKVPHMGWNEVALATDHPALRTLPQDAAAYFVHSYAFAVTDPAHGLATTDHGGEIAAIVGRDNILGVQFHPEKSQAYGLAFLHGFLEWRP